VYELSPESIDNLVDLPPDHNQPIALLITEDSGLSVAMCMDPDNFVYLQIDTKQNNLLHQLIDESLKSTDLILDDNQWQIAVYKTPTSPKMFAYFPISGLIDEPTPELMDQLNNKFTRHLMSQAFAADLYGRYLDNPLA
jgi:hypothetical protein